MALRSQRLSTPLGAMLAVAGDRGLVLCEFHDRPMLPTQLERVQRICGESPEDGTHPILEQTQRELDEYFLGHREVFS
ncbi:MAG: XRE family transcriptional regulator, partial [Gemmatimonadaceae bacterium]